jgi:hypothetical protein
MEIIDADPREHHRQTGPGGMCMRVPGVTAETALYKVGERYRMASHLEVM